MKLSIAWIFDHLEARWQDYDVHDLMAKFNVTTAEIEKVHSLKLELSRFNIAQVVERSESKITVFSTEWDKKITLPFRSDAHLGMSFLITLQGWATMSDLQSDKEGLLPAITVLDKYLDGSWKHDFEVEDYILELDNKSITHRPDMWCHRGFARELSVMLNVPLKPLRGMLVEQQVKRYEMIAPATPQAPISIDNQAPTEVKQFAGLYFSEIAFDPCHLWMAHRLAKIDARPINAIVDLTNYVMFDMGQPMHAFDAQEIPSKKIVTTMAKDGQKLTLLDGQTIELTNQDIVISDGKQPLALAGIMGGHDSAITSDTESIFLEAACFNPSTIRRTSMRLHKRTEASARFEKSLDPYWGVVAIRRFLKLMVAMGIPGKFSDEIMVLGQEPKVVEIEIAHAFIESRLGVSITPDFIKQTLEKLEFVVREQNTPQGIVYHIVVPSFRATKDIGIKEDIVEEVGRFYGFDRIPRILPSLPIRPSNLNSLYRMRKVKNHLAFAQAMHEVHNYALYDEEFLHRLQWHPKQEISIKNPVSELSKNLVTSLVPHLLKNVYVNEKKEEVIRFFEAGRVWLLEPSNPQKVKERKQLAGILFDRKKQVDFYDCKAQLSQLFELLEIPVSWIKAQVPDVPWYSAHQAAYIMHGNTRIGIAGIADEQFLMRTIEGSGFIFELDAEFIANYHPAVKKYVPVSKYPAVWLDISMLMPLAVTVDTITEKIKKTDSRITQVSLIDFFEKEEWAGARSLTFRYYIEDPRKTLERDEIDAVAHAVIQSVQALGAKIR